MPTKRDGVIVSVADTGAGVSSQDSERIFNPLFTTKPDGMGMGLSICRAIIEAHDGRLWVTAEQPAGHRVSVHPAQRRFGTGDTLTSAGHTG